MSKHVTGHVANREGKDTVTGGPTHTDRKALRLVQDDNLILTPGGFRPESTVYQAKQDELIRFNRITQTFQVIDPAQKVIADSGPLAIEYINPAILPPFDVSAIINPADITSTVNIADVADVTIVDDASVVDVAAIDIYPNVEFETLGPWAIAGDELFPAFTETPEFLASGLVPGPIVPGSLGKGWISHTGWTNSTGEPITLFSTTWIVPPAPATQSGQKIFLFNGLQDARNFIYQPVLQWGASAAGGGDWWSVASWFVAGTLGPAWSSSLIRVSEGDKLEGVMTLVREEDGLFEYTCEFRGIPETRLPIRTDQELNWAVETLEAYDVRRCSDYPATTVTEFRTVNIQTSETYPVMQWQAFDRVTDCNQHVEVSSFANPEGLITVHYAAQD